MHVCVDMYCKCLYVLYMYILIVHNIYLCICCTNMFSCSTLVYITLLLFGCFIINTWTLFGHNHFILYIILKENIINKKEHLL